MLTIVVVVVPAVEEDIKLFLEKCLMMFVGVPLELIIPSVKIYRF